MIQQLDVIQKDLVDGRPVQPVTVRTFLSWFQAQRRGSWIVFYIKQQLKNAGLATSPDFESAWIDAPITFVKVEAQEVPRTEHATSGEAREASESEGDARENVNNWVSKDATYRVSRLQAANQSIVSIAPDSTLAEAVTYMLAGGYSQLPVMTSDRDVKGVISWKTIGSRLSLRAHGGYVREFMDVHHEIRSDSSIFQAIPLITANDYVLVRGADTRISGIITSSDLGIQFQKLTEPFLLLSEIENLIRNMIGDRFSPSELEAARDPTSNSRTVHTVANMTFGEYIRLIQDQCRWNKLGLEVDRSIFCKKLDGVREIRNDVVHFDPDGISDSDLESLRDFAGFLKELEIISGRKPTS